MFTLNTFRDTVRVAPADLRRTAATAISDSLEETYVDRVMPDLGLFVALQDMLEVEGGFVFPCEGSVTFEVEFRGVIFRPLLGEILVGKLLRSNSKGLTVSLGFFEDVAVPGHSLQQPAGYDEAEGLWFWEFEGERMFYELGEAVRLIVRDVRFTPPPTGAALQSEEEGAVLLGTPEHPFVPMEVVGAMDLDGLGSLTWWSQEEEQ